MGGTFDPIHQGHLLIAELAREEFALETILFVPAGIPAHKKGYSVSDAAVRWKMTCAAIEGNPAFQASRVEIDRPGPSYAVDTIRLLCAERPGQKPYFITGMDAILEILTWDRAAQLPGLAEFVACARPGNHSRQALDDLPAAFREHIHFMRTPLVEISSTAIRARIAGGRTVRYMTPEAVRRIIEVERLYQEADTEVQ